MDQSGSVTNMNINNPTIIKNFLIETLDPLNISSEAIRVGVAYFENKAGPIVFLNEVDKSQLVQVIRNIEFPRFGKTNIAAGLKLLINTMFNESHGDRPGKLLSFQYFWLQ